MLQLLIWMDIGTEEKQTLIYCDYAADQEDAQPFL